MDMSEESRGCWDRKTRVRKENNSQVFVAVEVLPRPQSLAIAHLGDILVNYFPSHHPPLALRARFQSPRSLSALARDPASRVKIRPRLALEKPVEEAG